MRVCLRMLCLMYLIENEKQKLLSKIVKKQKLGIKKQTNTITQTYTYTHTATAASISPAESPKNEQPSLLSSSGDDLAAETPASDDLPSLDNQVETNGRQSATFANDGDDNPTIDRTSNANVDEPSYQNSATAIRTSTTSNGVENEYANTMQNEQTTTTTTMTTITTTTKTNGSESPPVPQQSTTTINDNNNSGEHVNGNADERKPLENNHSVAAATATGNNNKMEELYDIPVGEFASQKKKKKQTRTQKIKTKNTS